jgi:fructosamine-3-kinase
MSFSQRPGRSWGQFYAEHQILPYVAAATRSGALASQDAKSLRALAERVSEGHFDSPQPALLEPQAAARLHGDLWTGNVLWTEVPLQANQSWTGAVLIDPAAHGGHAETDLAMLALFGLTGLDTVIAAYNEVSPLAEGWSERIGLHQIYPLLVHAVLFGGAYGSRAAERARNYL